MDMQEKNDIELRKQSKENDSVNQVNHVNQVNQITLILPTPGTADELKHGLLERFRNHEAYPATAFTAQALFVLALFIPLKFLVGSFARLPEATYFEPVILLDSVRSGRALFLLVLASIFLAVGWTRLRWTDLEHGRLIRGFIVILCGTLVWAFSTYDLNLYYDRGHYVDRLALVALLVLVYLRPAAVPLLIVVAAFVIRQFSYPFQNYSWTDKHVIFDVLLLFSAALAHRLLGLGRTTSIFLHLTLCIVALHYLVPGIEKIRLGWVENNDLSNLFIASWDLGWLGFLSEENALRIGRMIHSMNPTILVVTMVVELSVIGIMIHRRYAMAVLCGLALMHLGIFASSGIFFWKWIIMDMALVIVLARLRHVDIFGRPASVLLSWTIMLLSSMFLNPAKLAWYDTPLSYVYRIDAIGESGRIYEVEPAGMSPYDFPFAQGRYAYLTDTPLLVSTLGSTSNLEILRLVNRAKNPQEIMMLERTHGQQQTNQEHRKRYEMFIRTYFGNLNARGRKPTWSLSAPQHILTFPHGPNPFRGQERVATIRVRLVRTLYNGERRLPVADDIVAEIPIP